MRHRIRAALTAVNGTTLVGLVLAKAGGASVRRAANGVLIAENYTGRLVKQTCFTVGSVVITRRTASWLEERAELLGHETAHVSQYAALGPLFWPAYWLACGWSYALTGSYGARNVFERRAGLVEGGYEHRPLRPWAARFSRGKKSTGDSDV